MFLPLTISEEQNTLEESMTFLLLAIIVWNLYEKKKARLLKEIEA